ncbi:multi-sensor signal transduction histidine kinase [Scytonema sp. HK-05]|uniref:PAS domain S-box protein n=1 Tax=Scytonema sp. HK-05 TaxID=1137095 RepID=UPI000937EC51|nr:PAS domain S-box protein [Scytonema sp. HK-05]OKH48967.1 PAS domain S-box protein [Scytonema sp. HK-05]BAY47674.1 multi-sensor signal transduction histidine kinase [Scytonema sp. HK-05]
MNETVKLLYTPDSQQTALPLLERIAANLPGMIFQFLKRQDGSQFVMYASSGSRELFELEPEVLQTDFQALNKLIHPQDVQAFEESIAISCATGEPWHWEGRIITNSGKLKWIQGTSRSDKQPSGDMIWDGLLIDITDRKLAQEKLQESEARYKAILDAIPDLMFRISRDGKYLDFKGEGANVTIPRNEIVGKNLQDLLPPDVALKSQKAIAKTLDSKTLQTCEYQLPTPLGMRDYEARLVVSGQDEVLAIVRDITERKQTEVALRNLAQKFTKVFRSSPNPISISTLAEGRYIEVNDSFVKQAGYEPHEAIGRTAFDLNIWVNESDRTTVLQELQKHGVIRNMEFEFRRKSGEIRTGLFSAEVIDLDGIPCLLSVNHDITERKKGELALRESEEKFSKAFRSSPNPITILTLKDGRYVEVNDTFLQITGFRREEVIGRTRNELNLWVNPSDSARIQQMLEEQGFIRNLEMELYTKPGQPRVVLFSAEVITLGGEPCMLCVTNDITERKQAEELLRLSSKRDRLLAQTLSRIRSSLNLDQILQTTVNEVRQFLETDRVFVALNQIHNPSGVRAESVNPKYPSVLNWRNEDKTFLQELKTVLKSNQVRIVEDTTQIAASPKLKAVYKQFQTRATLAVPIMQGEELFGALVANQCSEPRHWTPMEIDLLQQMSQQVAIAIQQGQLYQELGQLNTNLERQVEERTAQLQQKMQELQELNRVKDVVLHTVSHELRTSVMGNLMVLNNLLKTQAAGDHTTSPSSSSPSLPHSLTPSSPSSPSSSIPVPYSIIKRMIQGNDRQLEMIESLLELHSSEAQGIVLHREVVSFSSLVGTIIRDLEPMLTQHHSSVTNLVPDDLPLVIADPAHVQKVFVNLLAHSWQHNPPGVKFTLKATVETGMIRCSIQDDGVGMSKLECDRLFDLYVREPQARCSTRIGLKMYLCRQIIRAQGGEIGVTCNRKRGLTFHFTLPLANPS